MHFFMVLHFFWTFHSGKNTFYSQKGPVIGQVAEELMIIFSVSGVYDSFFFIIFKPSLKKRNPLMKLFVICFI